MGEYSKGKTTQNRVLAVYKSGALRSVNRHEKFDRTLMYVGFVVNEADKCVYYRYGGAEGVILCLYVGDMLIFDTSLNVIKEVKDFLSQSFEIKDLSEVDVILNIKLVK